MRIYKDMNVFDETLNRIRWLFDEFPIVIVSVSGGKDSTIIFHLAMMVAKELNRLPLRVMFIDQEAEWEATIDEIREIMYNPNVMPFWYQMPIQIFNATSFYEHWLYCWEEGKQWLRDKDSISIQKNIYNETRFAKLFSQIASVEYPHERMCYLSGVRVEESPDRMTGLTHTAKYKDITWGKILNKRKGHYTFYPIYDWSYTDIWKAIFDNGWSYNEIYNKYYADGIPFRKMRISNLHHEKAVSSLFVLQRYEPQTYEKLVDRLSGVDMAGKFGFDQYFVNELPLAFGDWKEYRDYLTENLLPEEFQPIFKKKFKHLDELFQYYKNQPNIYKMEIQSILTNDWEFEKLNTYLTAPAIAMYKQYVQGKRKWEDIIPRIRKDIEKDSYGKLSKTAS